MFFLISCVISSYLKLMDSKKLKLWYNYISAVISMLNNYLFQQMASSNTDQVVSVTVFDLLGIWPGLQTRVVAAYVEKSFYAHHYTTVVIVRHAIENIHFRLAQDRFDHGFLYVLCPTPEAANRLKNTSWRWMEERVIFRGVDNLMLSTNEVPPFGDVIEEPTA